MNESTLFRSKIAILVAVVALAFPQPLHAEEWKDIQDAMRIPVQKLKDTSFDSKAACEKLEARVKGAQGCSATDVKRIKEGAVHLVFVPFGRTDEVYIGVLPAGAKEIRYFPLGGYTEWGGGTSSNGESSLGLVGLESSIVAGQPALIASIEFATMTGDKISFYEEMDDCDTELREKHPGVDPTDEQMDACFKTNTADFIPSEEHKDYVYDLVFIGEKPRLAAAYLAEESSYTTLDGKDGPVTTKTTKMRFDGLSWELDELDGEKARGSLKDGPALLVQISEGEESW